MVSMHNASPMVEQVAAYRALAKRAQLLAGTLVDGPDRDELLRYAEEFEAQATSLEKEGTASA